MQNPFVKYGLYYLLLYIITSLVMYLVDAGWLFHMYTGWFWLLVLIGFMYAAIREKKLQNQGFLSLQQGFRETWLTFALGLGSTLIFNYILTHYVDVQLLEIQKEVQIEAIQSIASSMNLSEEKTQKQIEDIRNSDGTALSKLVFGYASFLLVGAIPAIILAAVLKKSPENIS
ncbi:MAG: DUF4199 domain-containing protein [Saprospiraceae bacterium]|nr:DUF4199 domain-containing protein [Saprospiraceae bacterium]